MSSNEGDAKDVQWMYKGLSGHVDREEYLTGRKVDKTFDLIREEEGEKSHFDVDSNVVPKSVISESFSGQTSVDVDKKMKEDPLYQIKMKEIEKRKELLLNPMKMKRLKQALQAALSSSDSDSESSSERRKHKHKRKKSKHKKKTKRKEHSSDEEDDRDSRHRSRHGHRRSRSRSSSRSHRKKSDKRFKRSRSRSRSPVRHHSSSHSKSSSSSKPSSSRPDHRKHFDNKSKPRLTEEEKEKRRREMMSEAEKREIERSNRVKDYKDQDSKEKSDAKSGSQGSGNFIQPLLASVVDKHSLEDRIKQKSFTSQRGHRSMESNFARK